MTITVTGATGHLGRLVIEDLLDRGVPAAEIVAVVRDAQKAADLAARGIVVRAADYDRPETLASAFAGTDKLLLISSNEMGKREAQHRNAIDAAVAAGVSLIAYTSILSAQTSTVPLAAEHKATETAILGSGLPYVFLRNGWYLENYTANLAPALEHGAILGSARDGRVAGATRADFAAAAAAVLTSDGPVNATYELGGDEPFSIPELAAEVSRQSGQEVVYRDLPVDEYAGALIAAGVPEAMANVLAACDLGLATGELTTDSGDLRRLIDRPTTSLADAVSVALKS
jgi:NAD(P)H dehydrogenase (quinone)